MEKPQFEAELERIKREHPNLWEAALVETGTTRPGHGYEGQHMQSIAFSLMEGAGSYAVCGLREDYDVAEEMGDGGKAMADVYGLNSFLLHVLEAEAVERGLLDRSALDFWKPPEGV